MSFQPFAVQCLTCGSNLRVTDPAIVGTIAACPKCNSMVQIEEPPGQVAVGSSDVDSQAITEEAIVAGQSAAGSSAQPGGVAPFAGSDAGDAERSETNATASPAQWQSEKTRRTRQIALVVAVSVSGLLSAVALFGWFVHAWRGHDSHAEVASADTIPAEANAPEPILESSVSPSQPADAAVDEDSADPPPDSPDASEGQVPPVGGDTPDSSPPPEPTAGDNSPGGPGAGQTKAADPASAANTQTESIPTDLIPQSPIDAIAEGNNTVSARQASGDDVSGMRELPPELEKYTKFLPTAGAAEATTLKPPPTMDEVRIESAAEDLGDPLLDAKPKVLNLKADLALPLALASDGYSLADLMLLVSQMTGVPIQIDWVSFDLAGTDIDASVATQKRGRSARELLEETAKALGAEIREEESLVVLTLSDATFAETYAAITDLQDFGDTRDSADRVLQQFLASAEGQDARPWKVGTSRQEQQLAALAVESLRRMRGLEPKVAELRLRRWAQSSEGGSIDWPLLTGGDAGRQTDEPITLAGFLRRTSQRNDATCIVNWYDANLRSAPPTHLLFPHADVDAATTLASTLAVFGLQVRRVDARHWWVGTEATYDRLPVLLWTPPLGDSRDAFARRITSIMSRGPQDAFRLAMDNESDRALLLLPRYIAGQLPKIAASIAAN